MRILIITVQYYPAANPNVYRWQSIAEYWVQAGHEVSILCSRRKGISNTTIQEGVNIYRAGHATLLDWLYNLLGARNRRGEIQGVVVKPQSKLRNWAEWLMDWSWRKFYWPDGSVIWYWPARWRLRKILKKDNYDAVISVGLPFTAHLLANWAKKQYPNIRWLMDIEDPFAISEAFFVNNFSLYRQLNFRAENQLLQRADVVSFTVEAARRKYEEAFPSVSTPLVITPPLFNLKFTSQHIQSQSIELEKGNIHIAYFGAFYKNVRTPDAFLKLLQQTIKTYPEWKDRISVHFFGELSGTVVTTFQAYAHLGVLHFHGLVSRDMVAVMMQKVDVLLNISNQTDYHLPSKSADYLYSCKPIINIYYQEQDTFKVFMKDYPLILNLTFEEEVSMDQKVDAFVRFLEQKSHREVDAEQLKQLGEAYTLERVANKYGYLLLHGDESIF